MRGQQGKAFPSRLVTVSQFGLGSLRVRASSVSSGCGDESAGDSASSEKAGVSGWLLKACVRVWNKLKGRKRCPGKKG